MPTITSAVVKIPFRYRGTEGISAVDRRWSCDCTTTLMSISMNSGQADRILRVRGRGGSAQLDFGRQDIGWRDSTVTANPIFDSHATARNRLAGHCASRRGAI